MILIIQEVKMLRESEAVCYSRSDVFSETITKHVAEFLRELSRASVVESSGAKNQ